MSSNGPLAPASIRTVPEGNAKRLDKRGVGLANLVSVLKFLNPRVNDGAKEA
jgi:hypothetical protein